MFDPRAKDAIEIRGKNFRFSEHPSAKGITYAQEGRNAIVFQLVSEEGDLYAFKVFKARFRNASNLDNLASIKGFSNLPGLQVCDRIVINHKEDNLLIQKYSDLEYSVLMPWITGETWWEILFSRVPFTKEDSYIIARSILKMFVAMEKHGVAHCDVSGSNLLISPNRLAYLVDIENMYGPGLVKPEFFTAGSVGYQHASANKGLWNQYSDRFAGSVLLCEVLTWFDSDIRQLSYGESYFASGEEQQDNNRFRILSQVLRKIWGVKIEKAFHQAWFSKSLQDCPNFENWSDLLLEIEQQKQFVPNLVEDQTIQIINNAESFFSINDYDRGIAELERIKTVPQGKVASAYARALATRGTYYEKQGKLIDALGDYERALDILPQGDFSDELLIIVRDLQVKINKVDEIYYKATDQLASDLITLLEPFIPYFIEWGKPIQTSFLPESIINIWKSFIDIFDDTTLRSDINNWISNPEDKRNKLKVLSNLVEALRNSSYRTNKLGQLVAQSLFQANNGLPENIRQKISSIVIDSEGIVIRPDLVYFGGRSESRENQRRLYREFLAVYTSKLPFNPIFDIAKNVSSRIEEGVQLQSIYVDTEVIAKDIINGSSPPVHISAMDAVIANRQIVLIGEPGAGKTTYVNYLANFISQLPRSKKVISIWPDNEFDILPIIFTLRDWGIDIVSENRSQGLTSEGNNQFFYIISKFLRKHNLEFLYSILIEHIKLGLSALIFDGIDELPLDKVGIFNNDVSQLMINYPKNRFIFTCRTLSFVKDKLRFDNIPVFEICSLSYEKKIRLIDEWIRELERNGIPIEDGINIKKILVTESPDLLEIASTPLFLDLLLVTLFKKSTLPDSRSKLLEEYIDILFTRTENDQWLSGGIDYFEQIKNIISKLAYEQLIFERNEQANVNKMGLSKEYIKSSLSTVNNEQTFVDKVFDSLVTQSHIFTEIYPGVFNFTNSSIKEYFAASYLSSQPNIIPLAIQLFQNNRDWGNSILQVGSRLSDLTGNTRIVIDLVNQLCLDNPEYKNEEFWAGVLLGAQLVNNLNKEHIHQLNHGQEIISQVKKRLIELLLVENLPPRDRVLGGEILDSFGDPRFDSNLYSLPADQNCGFIEIPSGNFIFGSNPGVDKLASEDEFPQQEVLLQSFYISRFPVTVGEFRSFVTESGYEFNLTKVSSSSSNTPITNISFEDALSYAEWLNEKLKEIAIKKIRQGSDASEDLKLWEAIYKGQIWATLPSEIEWEKSCRDNKAFLFPWGNEINENLANFIDTGIGKVSPVGCFPKCISIYGVSDLSGNIWEWTRSILKPYPYDPLDGRENLEIKDVARVVRGGAFNSGIETLRSSHRTGRYPSFCASNTGFRIALIPRVTNRNSDSVINISVNFFSKAEFAVRQNPFSPSDLIVSTTHWPSHSQFGNIAVRIFEKNLDGQLLIEFEQYIREAKLCSSIAYALYDGDLNDDAFLQIISFKIGIALTIVPLKISVLNTILSSQDDCFLRLINFEKEYIGRSNRFEEINAIQDPAWFFGRGKDIDSIMARLLSVQHCGIFGIRKIGKTSLLIQLRYRCNKERIPTAYLGLQSINQLDPQKLFADILEQFIAFFRISNLEMIPSCDLLSLVDHKINNPGDLFRKDIAKLWKFARENLHSPIMVILIDEIERIVPTPSSNSRAYHNYDDFFAPIRDLSQVERCIVSVVTGEKPIIREEFDKRDFLSNVMFELHDERFLSFFDYETCSEMIVKIGKWIDMDFSKASLERIFEETAGHPYLTRLLCARIVDNHENPVSEKDVENAIAQFYKKNGSYFKGLWGKLSESEKSLLERITISNEQFTPLNMDVIESLELLEKMGFIKKISPSKFNISMSLFRNWIIHIQRG